MSATSSPADSPMHMEPLHNPTQAAQVVIPQAPLGNIASGKLNGALGASAVPGMGAKALLAKKMAKSVNPKYISPTDNLMTPCSQKISAAKKKHFTKAPKPMGQLAFGKTIADTDESENVRPNSPITNVAAAVPVAADFEAELSAPEAATSAADADAMALSGDDMAAAESEARPEDKMMDDENPF